MPRFVLVARKLVEIINRFWANRSLRIKAVALLVIPLPILIAALAGLHRSQHAEQQARAWVQHTLDARGAIQATMTRLLDAEASARDFQLTGERSALEHYWESRELLAPIGDRLAALVNDNPPQFQRAIEVRELIRSEMDTLSALCDRRPGKIVRQEAGSLAAVDGAREVSSRLRAKLTAMQMEEDQLLQLRSQAAESARSRFFAVLIESAVLGLFFQMVAALVLTGSLSGQIRALENNARHFGQRGAAQPVTPDTREFHGLQDGLRQAATLMEENERALRTSEERFRTLFSEAPIAYHEIDHEGVVRHVNTAECALLGCQSEEIVGRHPWDLVSRESRDVVRQNILDRLAGVRPTTPYECDFECRDQSQVTVEIHENLIHDKEGRTTGIRSALLDVTARRMVDMAVKKVEQYAQELRTKNEELLLALGAAREASATKGRFLAAMSHELRTPLNGIMGLAELMFDGLVGPVSEEHKEYLGDILASSRHLLQLVNDVLDLAKVESGKLDLRAEPVELGPLLCEVRDVLRILADKKNISVKVDAGEIGKVVTDAARLKQVVYNYLSNAIKFTGEGGAIQVRALREGANAFRIEVEDNGSGIEEADIPRLFGDFQQLESVRPGSGTGLGLALTKRIIEGQGGSVGVRSQPGAGSVFFAILPLEPGLKHGLAAQQEAVSFGGLADPQVRVAVFPAPMRARPRSFEGAMRP
jgi:PAS domain S-box-containing protein